MQQYAEEVNSDELILVSVDACLDKDNFLKFFYRMEQIHDKAGSNDEAKYRMFGKKAVEHARLPEPQLFRGPVFNSALVETINKYSWKCDSLLSSFAFDNAR